MKLLLKKLLLKLLINANKSYAFQKYSGTATVTSGGSFNFSVNITTHGRPVVIIATCTWNGTNAGNWSSMYVSRGSTVLSQATMVASSGSCNIPGSVVYLEQLSPGTYTYTCTCLSGSGEGTFAENNGGRNEAPTLVVFEI